MRVSRQQPYYHVYRNRQSRLHHLAYMRLSKVYGALHVLERCEIGLAGKRVFDYGFGAGTLFLHCPKDARLFGVELDAEHVKRVAELLRRKGYRAELEPIDESDWRGHAMLSGAYDVVVASHVLEHLEAPAELLERLVRCARPRGRVVVLLPVNERVEHENHEWAAVGGTFEALAEAAGAEIVDRFEFDPFTYLLWPVFEARSRFGRVAAQGLSLFIGILAALAGVRAWMCVGRWCAALPGAKPAQSAFVLKAKPVQPAAATRGGPHGDR